MSVVKLNIILHAIDFLDNPADTSVVETPDVTLAETTFNNTMMSDPEMPAVVATQSRIQHSPVEEDRDKEDISISRITEDKLDETDKVDDTENIETPREEEKSSSSDVSMDTVKSKNGTPRSVIEEPTSEQNDSIERKESTATPTIVVGTPEPSADATTEEKNVSIVQDDVSLLQNDTADSTWLDTDVDLNTVEGLEHIDFTSSDQETTQDEDRLDIVTHVPKLAKRTPSGNLIDPAEDSIGEEPSEDITDKLITANPNGTSIKLLPSSDNETTAPEITDDDMTFSEPRDINVIPDDIETITSSDLSPSIERMEVVMLPLDEMQIAVTSEYNTEEEDDQLILHTVEVANIPSNYRVHDAHDTYQEQNTSVPHYRAVLSEMREALEEEERSQTYGGHSQTYGDHSHTYNDSSMSELDRSRDYGYGSYKPTSGSLDGRPTTSLSQIRPSKTVGYSLYSPRTQSVPKDYKLLRPSYQNLDNTLTADDSSLPNVSYLSTDLSTVSTSDRLTADTSGDVKYSWLTDSTDTDKLLYRSGLGTGDRSGYSDQIKRNIRVSEYYYSFNPFNTDSTLVLKI